MHPDLVVSDINMPEMNGIDLCKKIKSDLRTSSLPVILLTARTGNDQLIEGYETGANDYITKPFNFKYSYQESKIYFPNKYPYGKVIKTMLRQYLLK